MAQNPQSKSYASRRKKATESVPFAVSCTMKCKAANLRHTAEWQCFSALLSVYFPIPYTLNCSTRRFCTAMDPEPSTTKAGLRPHLHHHTMQRSSAGNQTAQNSSYYCFLPSILPNSDNTALFFLCTTVPLLYLCGPVQVDRGEGDEPSGAIKIPQYSAQWLIRVWALEPSSLLGLSRIPLPLMKRTILTQCFSFSLLWFL